MEQKITVTGFLKNIGIEHHNGWCGLTMPILNEIFSYNLKNPDKSITVYQVKQKFGRLRIYTTKCPDYIYKMITKAVYESVHICEICGTKGKLSNFYGCYQTLCEDHIKARKEAFKSGKSEGQLYWELLDIEKYNKGEQDLVEYNENDMKEVKSLVWWDEETPVF